VAQEPGAAPAARRVETGTLPRASTAAAPAASRVPRVISRRANATASLMSNERPGLGPVPSYSAHARKAALMTRV
jgi:hypothetical protein